MLTEKSTERELQPQMKKKGTALLAGYFAFMDNNAPDRTLNIWKQILWRECILFYFVSLKDND
jgi:hypothetical protein